MEKKILFLLLFQNTVLLLYCSALPAVFPDLAISIVELL